MNEINFYDFLLKIESIAKIGLVFSKDKYAIENYKDIQTITTKALEKFQDINFDRPNYFSREIYPTPSVSCRAIVFNESGELLMVKEACDGGYSLPGGWCDLYDSPKEATKREVLEEAGMDVDVNELVALLNRTPLKGPASVPEYAMYFKCKIKKDFHCHDHEITDVLFFSLDNLPKLSCKSTKEEFDIVIDAALKNKQIID
ncbi:MAG: NUDIX hydrolase N-terminal domain-containing protein [Bacilli bacterium]